MNTISNERLESLQRQFKEEGFNDIRDSEVMQLVEENLALRKERERAEPVAYMIGGHYLMHANDPKVDNYSSAVPLYTAPPAPAVVDDSLPYDPQIAEYEEMMEAEQAQADTTSQQFESLAGKTSVPAGWKMVPVEPTIEMQIAFAEAWFSKVRCVDDCELEDAYIAMLAAAPALVGKRPSTAEGNNDGFECTPVADLYELLTKFGECYDYTTSAKVAAAWIRDGYSAREYVKLDRLQEALIFAAPEPCK
ncbi:hypothetical protein ACOZWM_003280 [Cronobacter malonaticus]